MSSWENEISKCKKLKSNRISRKVDFSSNKIQVKSTGITKDYEEYKNEFDYYEKDIKPLAKNETRGIDRNTDRKLKSGRLEIDLTIDFHGMTLDSAFDCLLHQINWAYENRLRCILLITGKGKNTKPGRESIKGSIEKWLKHPKISDKIIKYVDATAKHGGTGATYVLLKRNRT